jgi:signal recognition particle subunit SRP54
VFSNLSKKLLSIIDGIRKRGILTEEVVEATIREIRVSLLEADVALSVVKSFSANMREKLIGRKVINNVAPEQTIIKIVYDELVNLLGHTDDLHEDRYKTILMAGLQGTGKTTAAAKLAYLLKTKFKKKVLLVSLDTYRPAAIDQLQKLASNNSIDFFNDIDLTSDTPIAIAQKAVEAQKRYDVAIYDTAGRLYLDEGMMAEIKEIKNVTNPNETFLVVDSMMGQDAINTAKAFNEAVKLTGLILTRVDGDSRGGAALSAKSVTNCQIKYICVGEKIEDIEPFYPERIASRILDKGDILSLVEKAMDKNVMEDVKDVALGKQFDLNGMEKYLKQLEKIGGISGFLKFLPGVGKIKEQLKEANVTDKTVAKQIAIIRSMTKGERKDPSVLNASRRRRIASGCGQQVSDVNRLIKQFEQVRTMMTKFQNQGAMKSFADRFSCGK